MINVVILITSIFFILHNKFENLKQLNVFYFKECKKDVLIT